MSKARTAAFHAIRFACRLQILARRLREAAGEATESDATAPLLENGLEPSVHSAMQGNSPLAGRSPYSSHRRPATPLADCVAIPLPLNGTDGCRNDLCLSHEQISALAEVADKVPRNVFISDIKALLELIRASWFSVLLVCCPLGIMSALLGWGAVPTFFLNFLVLIPLALILGDVTEDLALRMGSVAGGLLNATFGNVTELVLSIAALKNGLLDVVADSLLGSILSNLLLVLGCCFLVGGLFYHQQSFNATSNRTCGSLLFLAGIGLAIPTAAATLINNPNSPTWILQISRGTAIILLICYVAYLVFQLHSHKHLFDDVTGTEEEEEGSEPELPVISALGGVSALAGISLLVALHSEFLTRSIEAAASETGVSVSFLAVIVLPIAGNACEHITAVMVAARNKMDLSLGIAIGSSLQIALFVIPFTVLVGWAIGQPMSLNYDLFSVLALLLAVVHANFVSADASSHWLMGVQLCAVYVLIALVYWFRPSCWHADPPAKAAVRNDPLA